jgi:hypothetical protein
MALWKTAPQAAPEIVELLRGIDNADPLSRHFCRQAVIERFWTEMVMR